MKQIIQFQIAEPCHENWSEMLPSQQGRFCMGCKKEVVDFSSMTDKEILYHMATASSNVCGRVGAGQLEREIVPLPEPKKTWWKSAVSIAASSLMLVSFRADAQAKKPRPTATGFVPGATKHSPRVTMGMVAQIVKPAMVTEITGMVRDEQNNPVPYATVQAVGIGAVAADSLGNFILQTLADPAAIRLTISSVGYQPKEIDVAAQSISSVSKTDSRLTIGLHDIILREQVMDSVVVIGNSSDNLPVFAGGMSSIIRITPYEKIKNTVKDVIGINEVKAYPNPISFNTRFNVRIQVKDQGMYFMQFVDASGRIVFGRPLNITSNDQIETIDGQLFPAHGIYFINITCKRNGKMYSNKLLVE